MIKRPCCQNFKGYAQVRNGSTTYKRKQDTPIPYKNYNCFCFEHYTAHTRLSFCKTLVYNNLPVFEIIP